MDRIIQEIIDSTDYTNRLITGVKLSKEYYYEHIDNEDVIHIPLEYTNVIDFIDKFELVLNSKREHKKYYRKDNPIFLSDKNKIDFVQSTLVCNIVDIEVHINNMFHDAIDFYYKKRFQRGIIEKYNEKNVKFDNDIFYDLYKNDCIINNIEKDLSNLNKIYNIEDNMEQIKLYYQFKKITCNYERWIYMI